MVGYATTMASPARNEPEGERPGPIPVPLAPPKIRLDSVDILRGLVMVVMALDHTRDFFSYLTFPPEDMTRNWLGLWLTRWVTHFCAPAFVFLAGTGAFLSYSRGKSKAQISRFLWTRGLWLVFLEFSLVGYGWTFVAPFGFGGVIWMLGWCMVINAAIVRLPTKWMVAIGTLMVVGHNLLDGFSPDMFGRLGWLWIIVHQLGFIPLPPPAALHLPPNAFFGLFILYPLVPWIGVMSLGFAFGEVLLRPPAERQRWMLRAGAVMTAAFILLRATNFYGNPHVYGLMGRGPNPVADFHLQATLEKSFILFTNVAKYPPSLQFLLMTLGPSLLLLAWFDRLRIQGPGLVNAAARFFVVYGRVPMFYYVLHLYVIHLLAVGAAVAFGQPYSWLLHGAFLLNRYPPGYGHHLPFIYLMWATAVLLLYYPSRWFMGVKQRRRDWWLSYL
jgi:uncharacterized membrane protein